MGRASYKLLRYHAIYALKHDVIGRTSCSSFLFELSPRKRVPRLLRGKPGFRPASRAGHAFPDHVLACKAATSLGTNLLIQNIFLLPLTTTTSPRRNRLATSCGSRLAGSSCQPRTMFGGSFSNKYRMHDPTQYTPSIPDRCPANSS